MRRWIILLAVVAGCDAGDPQGAAVSCGPGTRLDPGERRCVPVAEDPPSAIECGPGTHLDADQSVCREAVGAQGVECGEGTERDPAGTRCVAIDGPLCGEGTEPTADMRGCEPVPAVEIECAAATAADPDGVCRPEADVFLDPGRPLVPADLRMSLARVRVSPSGILYVHQHERREFRRFDIINNRRLSSLRTAPRFRQLTIDPVDEHLYLDDHSGRIERVDGLTGERTTFTNIGRSAVRVLPFGRWLVVQGEREERTLLVFEQADGAPFAVLDTREPLQRMIGNPASGRLIWTGGDEPLGLLFGRLDADGLTLEPTTPRAPRRSHTAMWMIPWNDSVLADDGTVIDLERREIVAQHALSIRQAVVHDERIYYTTHGADAARLVTVLGPDFQELDRIELPRSVEFLALTAFGPYAIGRRHDEDVSSIWWQAVETPEAP